MHKACCFGTYKHEHKICLYTMAMLVFDEPRTTGGVGSVDESAAEVVDIALNSAGLVPRVHNAANDDIQDAMEDAMEDATDDATDDAIGLDIDSKVDVLHVISSTEELNRLNFLSTWQKFVFVSEFDRCSGDGAGSADSKDLFDPSFLGIFKE